MLTASAWLVSLAAAGGLVLIVLTQVSPVHRRWPGWLHGGLGAAGFVLLLAGLGGPARGVAEGAGSFGYVAAGFLAGAVLLGSLVFVAGLRRRAPSMLTLGVHATFAVAGVVMLLAYLAA